MTPEEFEASTLQQVAIEERRKKYMKLTEDMDFLRNTLLTTESASLMNMHRGKSGDVHVNNIRMYLPHVAHDIREAVVYAVNTVLKQHAGRLREERDRL